jgi:hypothetical protein
MYIWWVEVWFRFLYCGCDRTGQLGEMGSLEREGCEECYDNSEVSRLLPPPMSVKDRAILASMTSLELCTNRMSGFMRPYKPSSFCNYYVKLHLHASCGAFTFRRRMRSRAKTSSREQGPNFVIVGTCEWLSYVRAFRSQAYDVLVSFFPCMVYIDSSHRNTLDYECQLVVAVIS